ncbi:MAG TPA: ribonuclease R [Thermotogota bacterium]|nr:ribonuclease R [Thermotogota bacterium]HNR64075.1 ribonuclease R [Thermotogota bacterium]HNT96053.1 ribonuclease R [Thermotogota bacterium]HOZ12061.1 ribonuclease R [Thermotogota bacterium]HQN21464.1 ribonuclease R [Thermotogota bacterium]
MQKDKNAVLEYMRKKEYEPLLLRDLYRVFGANTKSEKAVFRAFIKGLETEGALEKNETNRYRIPENEETLAGTEKEPVQGLTGLLDFNRNGNIAFCAASDGIEYVVFPEDSKYALHRDLVQIKPSGFYKDWRRAQVVKILQRNLKDVVGILAREGRNYFVIPDDKRMGLRYYLSGSEKKDLLGSEPGAKVIARIVAYPSKKNPPMAKITRCLGSIEDPQVHLPSVIVKHGLPFPEDFPEAVLEKTKDTPDRVFPKDCKNRKDYRDQIIFTIDGESAKDFDDAVGIEKLDNGHYRLGVHIADVSAYVPMGSEIDEEAFRRGTSTYLLDTVIPMLPVALSNGICSLKENKSRLTLSLEMEIDTKGHIVGYTCHEGVIKSKKRLTYTAVNDFLNGNIVSKEARFCADHPEIARALTLMDELAGILRKNRKDRGAIMEIESGDVVIPLDEKGNALDIVIRKRDRAESFIEEFMLKANETVAGIFAEIDGAFVYRVHERPDPETLTQLKKYVLALGVQKKFPKEMRSSDIQEYLETIQDHPLKSSIQRLVVRSMKRAIYSVQNIGHYGLASENYTHFTSPIRRYPDLIVHRILKEWMKRLPSIYTPEQLTKIAKQSSVRERVSSEAEWDLISLKKVNYISRNLAELYRVVVTNIAKFGLFVEVPEKLIPGLIPISTLSDYFILDEERNILVGERTRKVYKIGDILEVRVKDIDYVRGEIDFELIK